MTVQDKIIERLDKAINAGSAVINSPGFNKAYADQGLYFAFKAHGLACLVDVLGANHSYTKSFEKMFVEDGRRSEAEGGKKLLQTVRVSDGIIPRLFADQRSKSVSQMPLIS